MGIRAIYVLIKQLVQRYGSLLRLCDLLLSKQNHNGAAARRFLLVLGAAFDARKLGTAVIQRRCVAGFSLSCYTPLQARLKNEAIQEEA